MSIPVNTDAIQEKFQELKHAIVGLEEANAARIDESVFISAKKLHLTILVLKLYSNESRRLATEVMTYSFSYGICCMIIV